MVKIETKTGERVVGFDLDRVMAIEDAMGKSIFGVLEELLGITLGAETKVDTSTVLRNLSLRRCVPFVAACLGVAPAEVGGLLAPANVLTVAMALLNELFVSISPATTDVPADPQTGTSAPA